MTDWRTIEHALVDAAEQEGFGPVMLSRSYFNEKTGKHEADAENGDWCIEVEAPDRINLSTLARRLAENLG